MIYIAIDGDNIHHKFEKCLLQNDEKNIIRTSMEITNTIDRVINHLQHEKMKIVFSAGDLILCKCDAVDLIELSNYLERMSNAVSVGIGDTL
ncbi:mCpol domain-containing protein [Methanomethylovorans sp.]|uniref:mCpol domain-containing protein n=1 Tax=Methanomethylovorans sp. TaxID=2758717 RepID=UPI00345E0943